MLFPGLGVSAEKAGCLRCVVDAAEANEGEDGPKGAPGCLGGVVCLVAGHAEVADGTADEGCGLLGPGHGAGALRGEAADGLQVVDAVGDGVAVGVRVENRRGIFRGDGRCRPGRRHRRSSRRGRWRLLGGMWTKNALCAFRIVMKKSQSIK